ncbi:plexin domain-containing protein 1-like [Montipora capricornis]|uniref:plexin domain-containing protein 1-like n=1 Tax=Montipora capricornis TaxID=246305 RepID=UPI0035F1E0D9
MHVSGCVIADSCARCMDLGKATEFNCQWCPATGRCSDGADRYRAEWENSGCSSIAVKKSSDERCAPKGTQQPRKSEGGIGAGAIFGICIVLVLVISIGAWCVYAYRYPTTKSGLFLIEMSRRPRELFNRDSSGSRGNTGAAAPSDVKPQVL